MNEFAKSTLDLAKQIQVEVDRSTNPPAEGEKPRTSQVVDFILVKGTRGYIERVVNQINGTYEHGWYDACSVMLRRLIETLIIEAYEKYRIDSSIQDPDGNFFFLGKLIDCAIKEKSWNLTRNCKKSLPKLKNIGDLSAHSRRYNANYSDIEKLIDDIRIVVQEFLSLAGLK